jgi:hypothetical protein
VVSRTSWAGENAVLGRAGEPVTCALWAERWFRAWDDEPLPRRHESSAECVCGCLRASDMRLWTKR